MSAEQSLWFLENIDVQGLFCPTKLGRGQLHEHPIVDYSKGQNIYIPGHYAHHIYFIDEGRVKISTINEEGKEVTKAILEAGEVFGELGVTGEAQRYDFAVAMEKTRCCLLTVDNAKDLMRNYSGFSLFLMSIIARRAYKMERRLESLVFKDSRTRVLEFIHQLAQERGQRVGYEMVVRRFITHQEIANMTATSRQTVTTILNDLRARNVLTFNRKRLLIRDMELLMAEYHSSSNG